MAASPYGDVMQCLAWGEVKKPAWQPISVSLDDDEGFVATALILKRAIPRSGRCIFYVPRGPIVDWSRTEVVDALFARLRAEAKTHKAVLIKIDPAVPSGTPGVIETLKRNGFVPSPDANNGFGGTQPRCVMKLDLAEPLDAVMARFHKKWRYNIGLAERKGVSVKTDCTREDLPVFHELYRTTAERDGFTGRPLGYFQKLWDSLVPSGLGKLFIATHEGVPLSAAFCFVLPPQCWYVYGASDNEGRNLMPNHAMQWAMISWAKAQSCTVYDFRGVADEGATPAAPGSAEDNHLQGLNRFKAGFDAKLVDYIGEWDLPLDKKWYWLWTTARPKLVAALKKRR